ncbi:MAG TPA: TIR domain-containing protein [Stellaceae bacterium]|nr:TIR domain-containing protein [Stellaceae bacterium]
MAKINQALLERLAERLNVTKGRVYALIQQISATNRVPRHLGALLLAGDNGISIQKYASAQDLADLRGIPNHTPVTINALPTSSAPDRAFPRKRGNKKVAKPKENTVFVVHGRDTKLRDSMYELLGALGLKAQEWGHAIRAARKGANPYVNDAVTKIMEQAQAIVVILSPDDEVRLKPQFVSRGERRTEGKAQGQARANVIFETGIAIGTHHEKTLIVQIGNVKSFTDIGGMHILRLTGSDQSRNEFANRLANLGCKIDRDGDHWLRAGKFIPTEQKAKGTSRRPRRNGIKGELKGHELKGHNT